MVLFPGCACCGTSSICDGFCSSTFSKRTNNIVSANGPHSGGYLFHTDLPDGLTTTQPEPYGGTLEVEIEGAKLSDWLVYTYWNSVLGYYHHVILPASYPFNIDGNTKSPLQINVYVNGEIKNGDFTTFGQCSATAAFQFLDSMHYLGRDDWFQNPTPQAQIYFNGYGASSQKANPMVIGWVNSNFLSADLYSMGGVDASDDSHYFIPDVIDEATIAPNWGTIGVQPYSMVPLAAWQTAESFYFKATRHRQARLNWPDKDNGPRWGYVGQVYEATIKWPGMLSIGPDCSPYTSNPLP